MRLFAAAICFLALTAQAEAPPAQSAGGARQAGQGQRADPDYHASVARPTYTSSHPIILFDAAHHNFHTADGGYKPFADLIGSDGYKIASNTRPFSAATLAGNDILVIVNASAGAGIENYGSPAFTEEECRAVADWVRAGGSLLLIADHMPFGAAAERMGAAFGVDMSKGFTRDPAHSDPKTANPSFILYSRGSHNLASHPITEGRNASERIDKVLTFTGQSLRGPAGSVPLLILSDRALDTRPPGQDAIRAAVASARSGRSPGPVAVRLGMNESQSAAGRTQGLAFAYGKGRVVVLGEAAMLTAQLDPDGNKFGMNRSGLDNRQLALNIMHWLSRALN